MNAPRRLVLVLALATASALLVSIGAPAAPSIPKIGIVCTNGPSFELTTTTGTVQTPDGNSIFMWGYSPGTPGNADFQTPGPELCVNQNEAVTITLHNTLSEPVSIVFPGQEGVSATGGGAGLLTREAAPGGDVTYTFTASRPGTYLYESGSDPTKQVEMGLFGALVVRPTMGAGYAYNDPSTRFDPAREYVLILSEIDPDLHHAVETGGTYDFTRVHNHYYTINGREFPDTIQDNGSSLLPNQPYGALVRLQPTDPGNASQNALIRMINAGELNHPFHPHGNHTREIAQDGRLLGAVGGVDASTEHFGETIGSGQTLDFLLRWDNHPAAFNDDWDPNTNPLPVNQPNYRDLTFKDGKTWYSGNPYLGYKGTLPAGTVSLNICGEWYFPLHSHALDEFSNFDEGFGGIGTLLRVDPKGGCFAAPGSTALVGAVLKSGSVQALAFQDNSYYQVNPKTTTRPSTSGTMGTGATTTAVSAAAGFPTTNGFYIRIDNEVMQVTGGAGTTTWTVCRTAACRLGTALASHNAGATVSALATDWYAGFTGIQVGSSNLKVTYAGKNCANTTGSGCSALTTNVPQQTVKICDWTVAGATGCSTATSSGWKTLPNGGTGPAQPQGVDSTELSSSWTLPDPADNYIGTGSYAGQVRVLVHTQRWMASNPTPFSTWGNFMKLAYNAP